MHISVQMTIHIIMGFCHAHPCMDDYPYYYGILSWTSLYEWLSILVWVFVIHIFVQMTIHILMGFRHAHLCTKDCFVPNFFPMRLCKTGIFLCLGEMDRKKVTCPRKYLSKGFKIPSPRSEKIPCKYSARGAKIQLRFSHFFLSCGVILLGAVHLLWI